MDLSLLASPLLTATQFALAMGIFAWKQPRRPHFAARVAALLVAYYAAVVAVTFVGYSGETSLMDAYALVSQIAAFVLMALAWVAIVWLCCDVAPTRAAFIAVAGYSTQNLADGIAGTIAIIISELTGLWPLTDEGTISTSIIRVSLDGTVVTVLVTVVTYAVIYRLYARRIAGEWLGRPSDWKIIGMFGIVLVIEIALYLAINTVLAYDIGFVTRLVLAGSKPVLSVFVLFAEFEILFASRSEANVTALSSVMRERERQYEVQRANFDAINVKVHDIKHQIRSLGTGGQVVDQAVLDDLAHEVGVFNTELRTGNDALDTILIEKGLVCEREGISLTCVADGAALEFLPVADLYSLFGNALDNAIRAAGALDDPARRSVSLNVGERAGMVTIHVENYFDGADELQWRDGLPRTTQGDDLNHGFGMRSMRRVAEAHDGVLTASAAGDVFSLSIMIPMPA